ncbi:MAG: class I SAM-dependent methyltransferase [Planctomycetes bacterium]|nr:class I SAM-dependent methyltransferase [Planctomycetota bacterium]
MNERVAGIIAKLERFMSQRKEAKPVPPDAGRFIHALLLAQRARHTVEIGTNYGYSGLWTAAALAETGGKMISIDHDPEKTKAAMATFEEAGLSAYVELRTGTAAEVLPSIDGPIDFVLSDADKDNCIQYVELTADKLRPGGVVLTDNAHTHAEELAGFLAWIRHRADFYTTTVSVGNGMELSVKRA